MRRAVERENEDINSKLGDSKTKPRRKPAVRRKRINPFLLLLVLLPVFIIGCLIFVLQQNSAASVAEDSTDATKHFHETRSKKSPDTERKEDRVAPDGLVDLETRKKRSILRGLNDGTREKSNHQILEDASPREAREKKKTLVLKTSVGDIKIVLRPDLSEGSVQYIYDLVGSYGGKRCMHCQFYRAEKPGILQGIMEHKGVVPVNTVRGACPEGLEGIENDCPDWDPECGCHGPIMTRGAVAWAAGEAGGPDFFIDGYPGQAKWWGTQHTNFGFIDDPGSLAVIGDIFELPIEEGEDMDFLKDPIHFDLELE